MKHTHNAEAARHHCKFLASVRYTAGKKRASNGRRRGENGEVGRRKRRKQGRRAQKERERDVGGEKGKRSWRSGRRRKG